MNSKTSTFPIDAKYIYSIFNAAFLGYCYYSPLLSYFKWFLLCIEFLIFLIEIVITRREFVGPFYCSYNVIYCPNSKYLSKEVFFANHQRFKHNIVNKYNPSINPKSHWIVIIITALFHS